MFFEPKNPKNLKTSLPYTPPYFTEPHENMKTPKT